MRILLPIVLASLLSACRTTESSDVPIRLKDLTVEVHRRSREVVYTNKEAGFFFTETHLPHRSGWHGWHVYAQEILEDYLLTIDGKPLERTSVNLAFVVPHQFTRVYTPGVLETVTLLDSLNVLAVELSQLKGNLLSIHPLFRGAEDFTEYVVKQVDHALLIASRRNLESGGTPGVPAWIGITYTDTGNGSTRATGSLSAHGAFAPAGLQIALDDPTVTVLLVAGSNETETLALANSVRETYRDLITRRAERMERLLNTTFIRTDYPRFDKAFHWAILSVDALIMNQTKKGIFAGLPWFNNYWGRDSFISLPGATLVTGNFSDAKEILRSFAEWQEVNPKSKNYGRIPNLVTTLSRSYNTADGTAWFCIALLEYVKASGDLTFARSLFPTVSRAIEGALVHRVDNYGFLTHEDAETWMDAVGPDGPWSPRGNRANDIQALWHAQLESGIALARLMGDSTAVTRWEMAQQKVRAHFNRMLVDRERGFVYDHLNFDGSPDHQFRPNQLFTLQLIDDFDVRWKVFSNITQELVYPHGVASLSQNDENFHPYHHYRPYYVQDAAYHNGIVWTWLAGPWISHACSLGLSDLAFEVTENMVTQILDRGAVGTLSELLEATPRPGEHEPRLSGTASQAWSLAEFIRAFYQDYLGVRIDALEGTISMSPRLPSVLTSVRFRIPYKESWIPAFIHQNGDVGKVVLRTPNLGTTNLSIEWPSKNGQMRSINTALQANQETIIEITSDDIFVNGEKTEARLHDPLLRKERGEPVRLAAPFVRPDLKALQGPKHRILRNEEVKHENIEATVLIDLTDPEGDDVGTGSYVYPQTPYLKAGSLDITRFTLSSDAKNTYLSLHFRALSNPGWHPEYGFQLTYIAIAIDTDGKVGSGKREVGMNAQFLLDPRYSYEKIIYVGGGVRIEDATGSILAEYLPAEEDVLKPLGSTVTRRVEFSLPHDVLGTPVQTWRYVVLVGCQDDYGGAGIGEFRTVGEKASEWVGGGKRVRSDPNVYDTILPYR